MKSAITLCLFLCCARLLAQTGSGLSVPIYDMTTKGQVLGKWLHGQTATATGDRVEKITGFRLETFRDGQVTNIALIAIAPECYFNAANNTAWDNGHIKLFTPVTNVVIEGDGFLYTVSNNVLVISNNTETRVLRSMLKSPLISHGSNNAPANAAQMIKIFSDNCRIISPSNRVDYAGNVQVIDPQLEMRSAFMGVQLTTNGGVETIHAWQNVALYPSNRGCARGDDAFYYVTNQATMVELLGHATWTNGPEQARAHKFTYDSTHHFLTATNGVWVQWPNGTNAAAGVRQLSADYATVQWPPTNGPVERMDAIGNVVTTNHSDLSQSTSDRAVYLRSGDTFELTGHPVWRTDKITVRGQKLTAELTNRLYHARGEANLRLKVDSAAHSNQWIYITCISIDYRTNLAVFHRDVHAELLESNLLRDTVECELLNVTLFSNQVETAVATKNVHGWTAPGPKGDVKTISCEKLTAHRSPITGFMEDIHAETRVVLKDFGTGPKARTNILRSDFATAYFAPNTNRLERAVADGHVVVDQFSAAQRLHATAGHADFAAAGNEAKLTGNPVARNDRYWITDADELIWQFKTQQFIANGPFQVTPVQTNKVASR